MTLWNGAPLPPMMRPETFPILTQNGGKLFKGGTVSYNKFPYGVQPPLRGTTDINTGKTNTLFLPTETWAWKISLDFSMQDSSWQSLGTGDYLEGYPKVTVYRRLFSAGGYVLDNTNSLFLFEATDQGKMLRWKMSKDTRFFF